MVNKFLGNNQFSKLSIEDRFWQKVDKKDDNGCWNWVGAINGNGYGCFGINKKLIGSHRFSYQIHFGEIPDGMLICHHCDNPLCINPKHLFLGTSKDNSQDAVMKGRTNHSENHPKAKLSNNDVILIRKMYTQGVPRIELSALFGVMRPEIYKLLNGQIWIHV